MSLCKRVITRMLGNVDTLCSPPHNIIGSGFGPVSSVSSEGNRHGCYSQFPARSCSDCAFDRLCYCSRERTAKGSLPRVRYWFWCSISEALLVRFCPETALSRNLSVNLRIWLCGVKDYASAQILDFLDLAKNCWFPTQKLARHPSGISGWTDS